MFFVHIVATASIIKHDPNRKVVEGKLERPDTEGKEANKENVSKTTPSLCDQAKF